MKINRKARIFLYFVFVIISAVVIKIFELYLYWYYIPIFFLICMVAYAFLIPVIIDYEEGGKRKGIETNISRLHSFSIIDWKTLVNKSLLSISWIYIVWDNFFNSIP